MIYSNLVHKTMRHNRLEKHLIQQSPCSSSSNKIILHRLLLCATFIIAASCTNKPEKRIDGQLNQSSKKKLQKDAADSITEVSIYFYPSFTNKSVLLLNRLNDQGRYTVDDPSGGHPSKTDTVRFSIKDMETHTDLKKFWSASFLHSLRQDTSMLWTDGMPVYVYFVNNKVKDSVYLGNVYSKSTDSILTRQMDYLQTKAQNRPIKEYIKQLKEYL